MSYHFICGLPRSGTTYLSFLINLHSEIFSTGETLFFGRKYIKPNKQGHYDKKQRDQAVSLLSNFITNRLDVSNKTQLIEDFKGACKKLGETITPKDIFSCFAETLLSLFPNKHLFIEKTPHHIHYTKRILTFYPEAKFIAVIRDPYEWLLSYKYQGSQKANKAIRKVFRRIYHPLFASLVYLKNVKEILRLSTEKNVLVLRNEKLNDAETTNKILVFIGVQNEKISLEPNNSSFVNLKKPELSPIDIFWINFVCKKVILKGGYSIKNLKVNPIYILISIFSIIPAIYYSVRYMSSYGNIFIYLFKYIKKL